VETVRRLVRELPSNLWLIVCLGALAAVAWETHHVAHLENEVKLIVADLDLGNPETTRLFRRTVIAQLEAISMQVHANAVIMGDLSERLTRITCECPGGVCLQANPQTGKCDRPDCAPPDAPQYETADQQDDAAALRRALSPPDRPTPKARNVR
jgi:hypothetical protein